MVDDLGVLVLRNELVDVKGVRLILRVIEGVTEIDQISRTRHDRLIVEANYPTSLDSQGISGRL